MITTSIRDSRPPSGATERPYAVVLRDVHKSFGGLAALSGFDLTAATGEITVVLGPNGAGKTTIIRAITGAIGIDSGSVATFGVDPCRDGESVRRRCGVVSAKPALYDRMTGWDNLAYAAALYGIRGGTDARIRETSARFGIENALQQYVGGYSTGMRTRLALSRALLPEPDLLLLDEPTSGLDPESAHSVLALIRGLTAAGTTAIMSTHLLVEAEGLADRIVVVDDGVNLLEGAQNDLIDSFWPLPVVRFDATDRIGLDALRSLPGVRRCKRDDLTDDAPMIAELTAMSVIPDLVEALTGLGVRLTRVEPHRPSLEDLYFRVRRDHRERHPSADAPEAPIGGDPT